MTYTEQELKNALRIQKKQILEAAYKRYEYKLIQKGQYEDKRIKVVRLDDLEEIIQNT